MPNSHDIAIEFANFLQLLKQSSVERYQSLYTRGGNGCKYSKKGLLLFKQRDEQKLMEALRRLYLRLYTKK